MIQQLLQLVRENSEELIVNNPEIPNQHNDSAMALVADTLLGGVKQMASNPSALSGLMSGAAGSGLLQQVIGSAVTRMSSELGVSPTVANNVMSQLLPKVMASFGSKLADPNNNEFTVHGLLQQLTGAEVPSELTSMLEKFMGGNNNQAQDTGASNMLNMVMGMFGDSGEKKA
jgi:hypothetical protein